MAVITSSILPIFLVIALGIAGARKGWFPPGFIEPANRLTYTTWPYRPSFSAP